MQKSATQKHIEAQLQTAIDLLKHAKRYVGQSTTIGGQDLSKEITEFVAIVDRNPVLEITEFVAIVDPNPALACTTCLGAKNIWQGAVEQGFVYKPCPCCQS